VSGRPPKPTALKILEGNRGRRDLSRPEPKPSAGVQSRPEWLCPEAKREWIRLAGELEAVGILSRVDRGALAAYCECWGEYVACVKALRGKAIDAETRDLVSLMVKMLDKMATFGGKLGLSPSDRVRLAVPDKPKDDLEQMLRGESVQ
jgi:P27 family predicted phage terminase small subunit